MAHYFFNGWTTPLRTFLIGICAYVLLIVLLRISGKRTLSKMNAFDFIVTIALGSTLASILLSRDVTLMQGGVALALLIGLQFIVTWTSVRISWVRRFVTGEPSLLLFRGELLHAAMRRTRVTEAEVRAAVRNAGLTGFDEVEAVVLETDASFSVIARRRRDRSPSDGPVPILADVQRP